MSIASSVNPFFSHPDFTVGSGILKAPKSPDQPLARFADYTAGRELHPAPKKFIFYVGYYTLFVCLFQ